ncbi:MAG: CvpA family protein [Christensenellaceae bacterium]
MNLLNLLILFFIAIYVMQGFHKGFLISLSNTIGMIISWIIGFLFSPLMSQAVAKGSFYRFALSFTNSGEVLKASGNLLVSNLSAPQIDSIVKGAGLPMPVDTLVAENMKNQVFSAQNITTASDYMNTTIANFVINIFSFLVIYLIARVVIALLVNAVNYASPLPVLKKFDSAIGGGIGFLRGFLGMFALFMIVPVILVSMPAEIFSDMIRNSSMVTFFYEHNFLLGFISGVL